MQYIILFATVIIMTTSFDIATYNIANIRVITL
jgi:hypothetical protein